MKLPEALVNFFGLGGIETLRSTHQLTLASFESIQGIEAVVSPIFPAILMCEIAFLVWAWRRSSGKLYAAYKIPVLMYVFNWIIGLLVNVDVFLWTQRHFAALEILDDRLQGFQRLFEAHCLDVVVFCFGHSPTPSSAA